MLDNYDFSNAVKNPYAKRLKQTVTIRLSTEVIEYFKQIRPFKYDATPVYPSGFSDISNQGEFATLGLINREKDGLLLFFWKFDGKKTDFTVPLKKWKKGEITVRRTYPENGNITASVDGGNLKISAKENYSASVFEVRFNGLK